MAFTSNFVGANLPLGCHCGSISGVQASFGSGYYAAENGKNIEVLDTTKERQIAYRRGEYSTHEAPKTEMDKIVKHLKDIDFKFTDLHQNIYEQIVEKCSNIPLWVMSDVINLEAPARKILSSVLGDRVYEIFGSTGEFAKYLIDNKIGYILASPIIQNPAHRFKGNYSLNQGWFWIPPNHLARAIDVAEVYGEAKFPTQDEWIKQIGSDLNIEDPDVLKQVLNDGVFPQDKRFKRSEATIPGFAGRSKEVATAA